MRRYAYKNIDEEDIRNIVSTLRDPAVVAQGGGGGNVDYWLYVANPEGGCDDGPIAMSVYVRPTGLRAYAFGVSQVAPPGGTSGPCLPLQYDGRIKRVLYVRRSTDVGN